MDWAGARRPAIDSRTNNLLPRPENASKETSKETGPCTCLNVQNKRLVKCSGGGRKRLIKVLDRPMLENRHRKVGLQAL
jgi:hypothetical protein